MKKTLDQVRQECSDRFEYVTDDEGHAFDGGFNAAIEYFSKQGVEGHTDEFRQDLIFFKMKHCPNAFKPTNEADSDVDYYIDHAKCDGIDKGVAWFEKYQHSAHLASQVKIAELESR